MRWASVETHSAARASMHIERSIANLSIAGDAVSGVLAEDNVAIANQRWWRGRGPLQIKERWINYSQPRCRRCSCYWAPPVRVIEKKERENSHPMRRRKRRRSKRGVETDKGDEST